MLFYQLIIIISINAQLASQPSYHIPTSIQDALLTGILVTFCYIGTQQVQSNNNNNNKLFSRRCTPRTIANSAKYMEYNTKINFHMLQTKYLHAMPVALNSLWNVTTCE